MLRFATVLIALFFLAPAAVAQNVAPIDMLFRALGLQDTIDVMRDEGLSYGQDMQVDLLEGRGGDRWPRMVEEIYDLDHMIATVRNRLDTELAAEDLAPMLTFFQSDLGQRVIRLEVSARIAFLDEEIEEMAKVSFDKLATQDRARVDLLEDFAIAGDLVNNNVMGALNSNFAFFQGLTESDSFPMPMTESEIIADVWGQEETIRASTTEWLFAYLSMAYDPLSDEELATYVAFSQSRSGRRLNQAIFAAFDEMFVDISLSLGRAASLFLAGEEL